MASSCDQRAANRGAARVVPIFLLGIVAYSCFVFTKPLCIDYFIRPTSHHGSPSPRKGTAAGLLTGFYILLFIFVASFLRLITTILWNPGYLSRGPCRAEQEAHDSEKLAKRKHKHSRRTSASRVNHERREGHRRDGEVGMGYNLEKTDLPFDATGLEAFYAKDIFVCQADGKPPWCSVCHQWKTDRAHHCSEAGRCVRKMDHFCPWVGGVVGETSFKFFIQFLFYGTLFAIYNLVVMAIFVAKLSREGTTDVHFVLILALSAFLGLFAAGMLGSSLHLALTNLTTIESLNRGKVWSLAVLIPRPNDFYRSKPPGTVPFITVSYPEDQISSEARPPQTATFVTPRRVFAILHTQPGENPFDLGNPLDNLREVMGYSVLDWFLPLKYSPCADHHRQESAYVMGPVVQRLKREAGLSGSDPAASRKAGEKRREGRRLAHRFSNRRIGGHALKKSQSRAGRHHNRHHRRRISNRSTGSIARFDNESSG
ncbi:hypothetical protein VTO42DRAFT_4050 [Malbranchea cinnamomea]